MANVATLHNFDLGSMILISTSLVVLTLIMVNDAVTNPNRFDKVMNILVTVALWCLLFVAWNNAVITDEQIEQFKRDLWSTK